MALEGENWDAIVVGTGIGGLTAAAYLAASGRKVLALEAYDVAGGNSHMFRRRGSYEFDVGVHYLGDCGHGGILPSILSGLGIEDRVTFRPLDQERYDRVVLPSVTVEVPASWDRYRDRLVAAMPEEAAGLSEFVTVCAAIADANRGRLLGVPGSDVMNLPPEIRRWNHRMLTQLFDHCGLSPRARTVLAATSGNYATAPNQTLVVLHANMVDDYMRGSYYPAGGGQALVAAFVEAIESHGGALWTNARVARIDVADGRTTGVTLADGRQLRAPVVVSNADYRRTVLELAEGAFPAAAVKRSRDATMRLATSTTYVAMDRELDIPNGNVWYWPNEDIETAYRKVREGDFDELPFAFMSFTSIKDHGTPTVCPPGHSNFEVMTLVPPGYAPWGVTEGPVNGGSYRRDPAYQKAKQRLTDGLLDLAEDVLGPIRPHITHVETATPLTHERYIRSSGGTPFGLATWGRAGHRPDVTTPVGGLYVAGQNTRFGAGIVSVAVSGVAAASAVMGEELMPEVYRGKVYGNSELLPERAPGWDPLEVSRGAGRKGERGLPRLRALSEQALTH